MSPRLNLAYCCAWLLTAALPDITTAHAQPTNATDEIQIWDRTFNLRGGFGFKDNVLLSPAARQDSAFFASGFDAMFIRLPINGPQFLFFLTGDDFRYLNEIGVDKEQSLVAIAKLQKEFASVWEAALGIEYFYQDQVFDVSATEADLTTVQLKAHALRGVPGIQRKLGEHYRLKLEFPASRQYLREPLDDYWEGGPKLVFEREYGRRSSAFVSYQYEQRFYDSRLKTDRAGEPIANSLLQFEQHEFELGNRHYWDQQRRWRSDTKFNVELNLDNGAGYFDYERYQFSQQLRYSSQSWMIRGQAKVTYYDYSVQTIAPESSETREFTTLGFLLRGEKNLTKSLKLFAEYDYEQAFSNRPFHEYRANTIQAGVDWEF